MVRTSTIPFGAMFANHSTRLQVTVCAALHCNEMTLHLFSPGKTIYMCSESCGGGCTPASLLSKPTNFIRHSINSAAPVQQPHGLLWYVNNAPRDCTKPSPYSAASSSANVCRMMGKAHRLWILLIILSQACCTERTTSQVVH